MRLIDADTLIKDIDRLIEQYEEMKEECKCHERFRLFLETEKEIEGMRAVRRLVKMQPKEGKQ